MTVWVNDNPTYSPSPIPEFRGNPLIECLAPPPLDRDDAIRRLAEFPQFNPAERELPAPYRMFLPARLTRFVFPATAHVRVLNHIYVQVVDGYCSRNPLTPGGQALLHTAGNLESAMPVIDPQVGRLSTISMVCGLSGMGKSTLIRGCMRVLGKPVIRHSQYNGKPLPETQILYLLRNVPDQCTPKAFCKTYGDYTDALLGKAFYSKLFADKTMTRTQYLAQLRRIIATHHVGALVVDCVENLVLAGSSGVKEFIAMLVNIRDELKVSLILVGTYRAAEILKGDISSARRLVEGGFHDLQRPESPGDPDFSALCEAVWECQWVKRPMEFDDQIKSVLFDCSQGITGLMLTLYVATQIEAIDSGYERVDVQLLRKVYGERFKPLHRIINAIRSRDAALLDNYDDLYLKAFTELKSDRMISRIEEIRTTLEHTSEQQLGMVRPVSKPKPEDDLGKKTRKQRTAKELFEQVTQQANTIPAELA